MTTTMEQMVIQLQQELFTLKAQVAARAQIAAAVQARLLTAAQVRKDTPSFIDVKGLGRPKEFSGKEEDFPQWSKKTESFFARVIKESEMKLEWAAEQVTEITTELIDREFLPTATNQERGVQNLEFVLQQMHFTLTAVTSYEANDIVANSRKNPFHWRHGDDCRRDTTLQQEEGRETFFALSFLRDDALFWNSERKLDAGSLLCRSA